MKTTIEFLTAIKARYALPSDGRLAAAQAAQKALGGNIQFEERIS